MPVSSSQKLGGAVPVGMRERYGYAAGDFGLNFYWQGAAFFLLYFYTDILGLPSALAGAVYAIGGVIDGIADPIMGLIAERTRSQRGRYRPYLLWGAAPLGVSFLGLFALPMLFGTQGLVVGAAVVGHILFRLMYTVVSIPYAALGTCLTTDMQERTRLAGTRMVFGALGGIGVVSAISGLRQIMPDAPAMLLGAAMSGVLASALLVLTVLVSRERIPPPSPAPLVGRQGLSLLWRTVRSLFANGPFLRLTHAIFAITLANMVIVKTVLYRFDHILQASDMGGRTLMVMTAVPLLSIPLWVQIYLRLDKRPAFLLGCLCVALSCGLLAGFGRSNALLALISYGLIAGSFSAFAVGFWSILPDTIDHGHAASGIRAESSLVGMASAIQKMGIALSGLGLGVALDMIGYVGGMSQPEAVQDRLHWLSSLAPAAFALIAFVIFHGYAISRDDHDRTLSRLQQDASMQDQPDN